MQQKRSGDLDIILNVLELCHTEQPGSSFIASLLQQYRERGSLSKKQLEGLHSKASKLKSIPPGKLATIQAIILKKPNRYKSDATIPSGNIKADAQHDLSATFIREILEKYPNHKRVLFFQMKLSKDGDLNAAEMNELQKFHKLLV